MVPLLGILGTLLILIAFILNQFRIWKNSDIAYDASNLVGSLLLVWYAWNIQSIPFVILNGVWCLLSLRDSYIDIKKMSKNRLRIFDHWLR